MSGQNAVAVLDRVNRIFGCFLAAAVIDSRGSRT